MPDSSTSTQPHTDVDDHDAVELWGAVIKGVGITNRRLQDTLRARFGLDEAEIDTMITLGGTPDGRASLTTLARSAAFTSGGYTKVARRLCDRGVVQREPDNLDRRVTYLVLTDAGRAIADEIRTLVAHENRRQFIDVLGPERSRLIAAAMDELRAANE
jgi:DNA-binding MarR family transcriptional regulator